MNLSLKNGWGLPIVVACFIMNIAILQGMKHKGEMSGKLAFSLSSSRKSVQPDIRGLAAKLGKKFAEKQRQIEIKFIEASYKMLPRELHVAMVTEGLIPKQIRDEKELANVWQNVTSLSEVNHYHRELLQDQTIKRKLVNAIPSDEMLSAAITKFKERRYQARTKNEKEKARVLKWFQDVIRPLKVTIKRFKILKYEAIKVDRDPKSQMLQHSINSKLNFDIDENQIKQALCNQIEHMLQLGINPNFVISEKSLLCSAVECNDEAAMGLLMQHGADVNFFNNKSTALAIAIEKNPELAIVLLAKYKADPNAFKIFPEREQQSYFYSLMPPMYIEKYYAPYKRLLRLLVEKGLDVNYILHQGSGRYSLLYLAMEICKYSNYENLDLVEFLLEQGANVELSYDALGYGNHLTDLEYAQQYYPKLVPLLKVYQHN